MERISVKNVIILQSADDEQLRNIRDDLKEDPEKLKHYVKLFNDWLNFQEHLPKNVEPRLIENYIRLCKNDLEKAKNKFETFIISTEKYKKFYNHGFVKEKYFFPYEIHRMVVPLPQLSKSGHRVIVTRILTADTKHFDLGNIMKYCYFIANYLFHNDVNAGLIHIFEFSNSRPDILGKLNFMVFKEAVSILLQILPGRVHSIHIINLPFYGESILKFGRSLLKEKLRKRIFMHKAIGGLLDYFKPDMLPKDFGGRLESLDALGNAWKEHFLQNKDWIEKTSRLKVVGPVPKHKQIFDDDDDGVDGSFRQLAID